MEIPMRTVIFSALLAASMSSFAATPGVVTGSPSAMKVVYTPNSIGPNGLPNGVEISLYNSGSSCSPGVMVLTEGYEGRTAADVKAFYDFMLNAKSVTASNITLNYTPGGACVIQSWTRN
jgi:hypothetical protein